MPATVIIYERTGTTGSPTNTDITTANSRYMLADATSINATSNPVQIPNAGTNYSYFKSRYLHASTTPAGTIDTVKYYTDGTNSYGTGVTEKVATVANYVQATGSATSGTQLTIANYAGISPSPPNDSFGYNSGSALAVAGSISNPATGKISDFWVEQLEVASTATPGAITAETKTISWNET